MSATDTRSLVVDYVQYQLRKKALPWPGHPDATDGDADPDPTPSKVNQTMRLLGEEFEERYTQVLTNLSLLFLEWLHLQQVVNIDCGCCAHLTDLHDLRYRPIAQQRIDHARWLSELLVDCLLC